MSWRNKLKQEHLSQRGKIYEAPKSEATCGIIKRIYAELRPKMAANSISNSGPYQYSLPNLDYVEGLLDVLAERFGGDG